MSLRKVKKLVAGIMVVGMVFSAPGMTNFVYAVEPHGGSVEINEDTFPDQSFRYFVSQNIDKDDEKGVLSQDELDAVTEINVSNTRIESLEGIKYFTNLQSLDCSHNEITSLNLENNTKLTSLNCLSNPLVSLNLENNKELKVLNCNDTYLNYLNLKNNDKISELYCGRNYLRGLDLADNVTLTRSYMENRISQLCYDDERKLDWSDVPGLDYTKLSNIEGGVVSDSVWKINEDCYKLTYTYNCGSGYTIDFVAYLAKEGEPEIPINADYFPDYNFRRVVSSSNIDVDYNGKLSANERYNVNVMDAYIRSMSDDDSDKIKSLQGIEFFPEITTLYCSGNKLSSIDVSSLSKLEVLSCSRNILEELDVSHNSQLKKLSCGGNMLTDLKIAPGNVLEYLECSYNKFTQLDTSNEPKLEYLYCNGNDLTSLNVEESTGLKELVCGRYGMGVSGERGNNRFTYLDLRKNTQLEKLDCGGVGLENLDLSNNCKLTSLRCNNNQLSSLDISKLGELGTLDCENNQLTSLDVSNNSELVNLYCKNNKIENLDLSQNSKLTTLTCENNQLTSLDVSYNRKITSLPKENVQSRSVVLDEHCQVQLGAIDSSKISDLRGGTIEGNTLTANAKQITYIYDCSRGYYMDVTLLCDATGYVVSFEGNGANSGPMNEMTNCSFNSDITLSQNQYKKDGYLFKGWNTKADGSGTAFADGATVNFDENNYIVVLYAQWEKTTEETDPANPVDPVKPDPEDPVPTNPDEKQPVAAKNGWETTEDNMKYYYRDGIRVSDQWLVDQKDWYYLNEEGNPVTGWMQINGPWYYFGKNGVMITGWQNIDGKSYYFYSNGSMAENAWVDGYYVGRSGAWVPNPVSEGWQKSGNKWWYQYADGSYPANTWNRLGGIWYYFDAAGWMSTGWTFDGSNWYYMNEDGTMKTGWLQEGNTWYYMDSSGAMQTGWVNDGGTWYYMDNSGAMKTGWVEVNGEWYYLYESGAMAHDTVVEGYTLNSFGAWIR